MKSLMVLAGAVLLALLWSAPVLQAKDPKFVGVAGCTSKCHKKEADGDQRSVWEKSKHAKSFENLGSKEAKERAQKAGVTTDPQKTEACLVCHTTGYGLDKSRFDKKFKMEDGVQCESCHGAGDEFKKKKTMIAITKERGIDGKGDSATAKKVGLTFPDEKSCKQCHAAEGTFNGKTYKNPSYKDPLDFKASYKKMEHPVPEAQKKKIIAGGGGKEEEEEEEE